MTVKSSGELGLYRDIVGEYGGTAPHGLSEYRNVPNGPGGSGQMSMGYFYGKSNYIDQQTITVGTWYIDTGFGFIGPFYGYSSFYGGSISDGTSNVYGGAAIAEISWFGQNLIFQVAGSRANSGWSSLVLPSGTFTRASATYQTASYTSWSWATSATNPIGTSGTAIATFYP